jgi:hypothetical protein
MSRFMKNVLFRIRNFSSIKRCMWVIFQAYNSPETEYYNCAVQLEKFFYNKLRDHCLIDKAKD